MKARSLLLTPLFLCIGFIAFSQKDTSKNYTDTFLLKKKGFVGKLARSIMKDEQDETVPVRNDLRFQKYKGKIIRNIIAGQVPFGIPINDTSKSISTKLTRVANKLHKNTRSYNIIKNLFFSEHDKVEPFLMADNERYLRDLSFLSDARITILPIVGKPDSVDVVVQTKDVFSLGIDISEVSVARSDFAITEDNIGGSGNRISLFNLYEKNRTNNLGLGGQFVYRNIEGTFIDAFTGYSSYGLAINGRKEENNYYVRFVKPLVNPYVQWTYALEASAHSTRNMYSTDSFYNLIERYKYGYFDVWAGKNIDAQKLSKFREEERLRGLIALRVINKSFQYIPQEFDSVYNWRYADVMAVLGSFSVFRQDFYKARYFYGFGRIEDVPEGITISVTGGPTVKHGRKRPYAGFDFERYYFSSKGRYYDYTFRGGGFLYKSNFEDVNLLANLSYFDRLKKFGKWKQRFSLEGGFARQINSLLNEPIIIQSSYGLPEFLGTNEGSFRATLKGETVFYSPLNIAAFKFAPFVFGNLSYLTPNDASIDRRNIYTSIGGGLRTRNESLIFGTLEAKAYYFPQKNLYNSGFRFEFNTNIRFKYNTELVKRPDFVNIN
jgi:hypothetical protein